jgi:Uma2 family endonuclease
MSTATPSKRPAKNVLPEDTLFEIHDGKRVDLIETPLKSWPEESQFEMIDGVPVEVPAMGVREAMIASDLCYFLGAWGRPKYGRAVVETLFDIPNQKRDRRPDVAFVSYARWPRTRRVPSDAVWAVVPEVAIEVVSPTNSFNEVLEKLREYFTAGVQQAWIVVPAEEQVYVYTSPTTNRILTRADDLTAEPLLPGFRLPLAELFGDATED